jgi:CRP-like cAMP-binding protein
MRLGDERDRIQPRLSGSGSIGLRPTRRFAAGSAIFDLGSHHPRVLFMEKGWAISSKVMGNGARILTDFFLRGDILSSASAAMSQETIHAVSDVSCVELFDPASAGGNGFASAVPVIITVELMKRHARMTERLASIGRRDAFCRTGHLFLELAHRAGKSSRYGLDGFECPLRQSDIGDALGLSTVHISRVLKDMRVGGLLSFRNGVVEFLNRRKLAEVVGFEPDYLACTSAETAGTPYAR